MTNNSEFTRILNSREPFDFIDSYWFWAVTILVSAMCLKFVPMMFI
jgi:hypothetical protein